MKLIGRGQVPETAVTEGTVAVHYGKARMSVLRTEFLEVPRCVHSEGGSAYDVFKVLFVTCVKIKM